MTAVEQMQGGAGETISWRNRMVLSAAGFLLAVTITPMGAWATDAECRAFVERETAAASYQDREPRKPWRICDAARWVLHHTP